MGAANGTETPWPVWTPRSAPVSVVELMPWGRAAGSDDGGDGGSAGVTPDPPPSPAALSPPRAPGGSCSSWAGTDRSFRGDPWGRSSLHSASTQPGLCKEHKPLDYFMDESAGNADGALGAASPGVPQPGRGHTRGARAVAEDSGRGQWQRATLPAHPRSPPGMPAEPHSALGNARHGATGRGDNNRE